MIETTVLPHRYDSTHASVKGSLFVIRDTGFLHLPVTFVFVAEYHELGRADHRLIPNFRLLRVVKKSKWPR